MTDTAHKYFTLRVITDPAAIDMRGMDPSPTIRFGSDLFPWRRVRRLSNDVWLWQSDEGSEGHVQTRDEAFTMVAFQSPDLRHLVLEEVAPPD